MAEHNRVDVVPVESNLAKAVKEEQAKDRAEAHKTADDAGKKAQDAGKKAQVEVENLTDRIKKGDLTDEDKKKLGATAGAVIAFIAALAFGGYKYHQHRQHKKEEEELEAKAGYLKEKGSKLGGWFGKKAEEAKDVALDAKDVVADKAGDAAHRVGDGLKGAADKVKEEGRDTEKALMKGSEKSDHLVRSTYDKAAEKADYVKDRAHHASGHIKEEKRGFWNNVKGWLHARKGELDEAARIGRKEQQYVADKTKAKAHKYTS